MLVVCDNLELALKNVQKPTQNVQDKDFLTLYEGVEMTNKTVLKIFEKFDVVKAGSLGKKADHNIHEVLFTIPMSKKEENEIIAVVREGYWLKNRILRSAQVGVVVKPAS